MKNRRMMDRIARRLRLNNKGAVLMFSYLILTVLFTLMAGFALSTAQELRDASRFRDATAAFWLAEAGINEFIQDTAMLDEGDQTIYYGSNYVTLTKDDTDSQVRYVTAAGHVKSTTRRVEVEFPANPPAIFSNTMSSGGDINLIGILAQLEVFGPTRITGTYNKTGLAASGWFEDKQEGVSDTLTTFKYPDMSDTGTTPDEFDDFVDYNRAIVSSYPSEEIVYIQSDDDQFIWPMSQLSGKRIVFVEGSEPGKGNVDILFDASGWRDEENLTVITTGSVNYVQPLQLGADSKLNIIAWQGYNEASILYSAHDGITFTHDEANFYSIFDYSETNGNLVANAGINASEALSWKRFRYADPLTDGVVPPGFEGLIAQGPGGYSSTLSSWKEK